MWWPYFPLVFCCLFIEGSLSVITIHTLELLDWKDFAAFGLLMSCNAVNNSPGLTLRDLERPLAGRWKSSRIMSRLDRDAVPLSFLGPRSLRPQANDFWREHNTSLILEYFLPCAILFPNFLFCGIYMCSIRKKITWRCGWMIWIVPIPFALPAPPFRARWAQILAQEP